MKKTLIIAVTVVTTLWLSLLCQAGSASTPEEKQEKPKNVLTLSHDDGKSVGHMSIAGGGHGVKFEVPADDYKLTSVAIYGSRYGYPQPPKEDFNVWLCDSDYKVIKKFSFPYSKFKRGEPKWVALPVKPTEVPENFVIFVGFNPEQTKGVYVEYSEGDGEDSLTGIPGGNIGQFAKGNWMIRAKVKRK